MFFILYFIWEFTSNVLANLICQKEPSKTYIIIISSFEASCASLSLLQLKILHKCN